MFSIRRMVQTIAFMALACFMLVSTNISNAAEHNHAASKQKAKHTAPTRLPVKKWTERNKLGQIVQFTATGTLSGHSQYRFTKKSITWRATARVPTRGSLKTCQVQTFRLTLRAVVLDSGASARAKSDTYFSRRDCITGSAKRVATTDRWLCHLVYKQIVTESKGVFNGRLRQDLDLQLRLNRVAPPAPAPVPTPAPPVVSVPPAPVPPTPEQPRSPTCPDGRLVAEYGDCDRWPIISMMAPPHIYEKGSSNRNPNQEIFLEAFDEDGEHTSVDVIFLEGDELATVNSLREVPYRWNRTPCPTGVTCHQGTLWGISPGWVTIQGVVTAGNGFGMTAPYRFEVRADEF